MMTSPHSLKMTPPIRLRRLAVVLVSAGLVGALFALNSSFPKAVVISRTIMAGLVALCAYSYAERWPRELPNWLPRWLWQLIAVALSMFPAAFGAYWLSTGGDPQWHDSERLVSTLVLAVFGGIVGLWIALIGIASQREHDAHAQKLELGLAQSELARLEVDSRLRLLQAQTTPHFVFNTLANVQALVELGAPDASKLLAHLIRYLRAAVPHAGSNVATVAKEVEMANAYLEIMRIRMPDRLQFSLAADPAALALSCPSMTLLSLIENAVRHGIDPSEDGGCIVVRVQLIDFASRCQISVRNSCPHQASNSTRVPGLGSGLNALSERLRLMYENAAALRVSVCANGDFLAELDFPCR